MSKKMNKKEKSKRSKQFLYILLPFILPLCLIGLGILLLSNEAMFNRIFLGFGILIALIGLIDVVIYASRRKYEVQTQFLITGCILLAVGAILITIPLTVNTLIPMLIGICVLGSGISGIVNTLSFRQENCSIVIPMMFAVTNCLLGIFILIYVLFVNKGAGWNVIGILMIISGVLRVVNEILARIHVPKMTTVKEEPIDAEATISDNNIQQGE